jgi:hypothetical protein
MTIYLPLLLFLLCCQLPPHYLNLFLPALDTSAAELCDGHAAGQTAFLVGSHKLKNSAALMNRSGHVDRSLIDSFLVRPHCQVRACVRACVRRVGVGGGKGACVCVCVCKV